MAFSRKQKIGAGIAGAGLVAAVSIFAATNGSGTTESVYACIKPNNVPESVSYWRVGTQPVCPTGDRILVLSGNDFVNSTTTTTVAPTTTTTVVTSSCTTHVVPGQNITSAVNNASANATVCVDGGTYTQQINVSKSHIILQATPGQTPIISGVGLSIGATSGLFTVAGGVSYDTINGFTIQNSSGRGLVNGGNHNLIENNIIDHAYNAGIQTTSGGGEADYNSYLNNEVEWTVLSTNCFKPSDPCTMTGGWQSAIDYFKGSGAWGHNTFQGNYVHNNGGEGIGTEDYDQVLSNRFVDNYSVNIYMDGVQHVLVQNNTVVESETAFPSGGAGASKLWARGVNLSDELSPAHNAYNTITGNTFTASVGIRFWNTGVSGTGLIGDTFTNNIVKVGGLQFDSGNHSGTLVSGNDITGSVSGLTQAGITSTNNTFH